MGVRWIAGRNVADRDFVGARSGRAIIVGRIIVSCHLIGGRDARICVSSSASGRNHRGHRQSKHEKRTVSKAKRS
jgi:hypothetical protein